MVFFDCNKIEKMEVVILKKAASMFLALSLVLPLSFSPSNVLANESSKNNMDSLSEEEQRRLEKRFNEIKEYFSEYYDLVDEHNDIQKNAREGKLTKKEVGNDISLAELEEEIDSKKQGIEDELGLKFLKKGEIIQPLSTSADVRMVVDLYYDDDSEKYVLDGAFAWKNDDWTEEWDGTSGDIGGLDGLGLSIENEIDIYDEAFITYYSSNSSRSSIDWIRTDDAELDYDANGLGFRFQDAYKSGYDYGYNAESGYALVFFEFDGSTPEDEGISINMGMAHTWDNTEVNSVSIGPWSVGFGYNRTSDKWEDEVEEIIEF